MPPNESGKDATATDRNFNQPVDITPHDVCHQLYHEYLDMSRWDRMLQRRSGEDAIFTKRTLTWSFEFSPGAIEAYKGHFEKLQTSAITPRRRKNALYETNRPFSSAHVEKPSRQEESGNDTTATNRNVKKPPSKTMRRENIPPTMKSMRCSEVDIDRVMQGG